MDIGAKTYSMYYQGVSHRIISNDVAICSVGDTKKKNVITLWDTGASICAIHQKIAEEIGLVSLGKKIIGGVHGSQETNYYLIDILLPSGVYIPNQEVVSCNTSEQFIIGMNVLTLGDFCISNYMGKTTATFVIPSQRKTDYVEERNTKHLHKFLSSQPKGPIVLFQKKGKHGKHR